MIRRLTFSVIFACMLITTGTGYTRETHPGFDLSGINRAPVAASLRLSPLSVSPAGIHAIFREMLRTETP